MQKLVVFSNIAQYEAYCKDFDISASKVFCDNRRFEPFLRHARVSYMNLDEFLIRPQWDAINQWGASKAADWIGFFRKDYPQEINLAEVIYLHFSYILIQMVKNFAYAKHLIGSCQRLEKVVTFRTNRKAFFPNFDGNFFLNFFLNELSLKQDIASITIEADSETDQQPFGNAPDTFLLRAKALGKKLFKVFLSLSRRLFGNKADVLAYGSIRHLGPVIDLLSRSSIKVGIYDFDFHQSQFAMACRVKGPYFLSSFFQRKSDACAHSDVERWMTLLQVLLNKPENKAFWIYDGYDFLPFVKRHIFPQMKPYFLQCAFEKQCLDQLFNQTGARAILVDEDFGGKGSFFASFAMIKGMSLYCISHANLAVDFSIKQSSCHYGKGVTFTHSTFERDMYMARGWNPKQMVVCGTPRFDNLFSKPSSNFKRKTKHPFRVLICAGCLWEHTPDNIGYLGDHLFSLRQIQEPAFLGILKAVQDLPVSLMLKPHDFEDENCWQILLHNHKGSSDVHFFRHNDSFADLIRFADLMVVSYLSTAIIECGIINKTVFYYEPCPSRSVVASRYEEAGLCKILYTPYDLRRSIQSYLQSSERSSVFSNASSEREYYLGVNDGLGARRVANYIINDLMAVCPG